MTYGTVWSSVTYGTVWLIPSTLQACLCFNPHERPTFPQMYRVFKMQWTPQPQGNAEPQNSENANHKPRLFIQVQRDFSLSLVTVSH